MQEFAHKVRKPFAAGEQVIAECGHVFTIEAIVAPGRLPACRQCFAPQVVKFAISA